MSEPLPAALSADRKLIKIPFLRGIFVLYETLVIGTRMLMRSAAIAAEGEDVELGKGTIAMTMIVSIGFAIGLFFLLPLFLSTFAEDAANSDLVANIGGGADPAGDLRRLHRAHRPDEDIRRVFAYHGAEHKAISAHEADRPLTPDEVDAFGTAHTRCGTTFILIVVVISIFFFSLIPRAGVPLPLLFLSRIVLVPVIAAFAYELVRFGARHYGNRARSRALHPWACGSSRSPPGRRIGRCSRSASPASSRASPPTARLPPRRRHDRPARRAGGALRRDRSPACRRPRWRPIPSQLADLGRELSRLEPIVASAARVPRRARRARGRAGHGRRPRRGDARHGARRGRAPGRSGRPRWRTSCAQR